MMTEAELITDELAARELGASQEDVAKAIKALQIPSREGRIPRSCVREINEYLTKQGKKDKT